MQYRYRIVTVEAFQWERQGSLPGWATDNPLLSENGSSLFVSTMRGPLRVNLGDYVVKKPDGSLGVYTPEMFEDEFEEDNNAR